MKFFFELWLAWRYLRAKKGEKFLSIITVFSLLGIMLGVATLIIVMAVMNGFRQELFTRILGFNGHMMVYTIGGPLEDYNGLVKRLKGIEGVISAEPLIEGQVMVTANGLASGAMVRGVRPGDFLENPLLSKAWVEGEFSDFQQEQGIVIGSRMAERYGLTAGDTLTLISPRSGVTAFGSVPRSKTYEIVGTFQIGMYEYDNSFIFMPLSQAQVFFQTGASVNGIEVRVEDPQRIEIMRERVFSGVDDLIQLVDWRQTNKSFFDAIEVERNVMFLILTLIIIVATFNIISMLIILVKEKRGGIAILRAMGASTGSIMRIFLFTGLAIGVGGTLAGFGLGVMFVENIESIRQGLQSLTGTDLFSAEIYFLSRIPAQMDWAETLTVVMMALGLSLLATLYPSWKAARTDPVEILRHE